ISTVPSQLTFFFAHHWHSRTYCSWRLSKQQLLRSSIGGRLANFASRACLARRRYLNSPESARLFCVSGTAGHLYGSWVLGKATTAAWGFFPTTYLPGVMSVLCFLYRTGQLC
ncbi:unnamed protein product, partial [Ectocarpus sp. 4 AP-2014]